MTIAVNRNLSNSVFHSVHGLMNSINWPASSIWVFIAQLGEHCSANVEATGSNPVEVPKNFFFRLFSQLLKLRFTAMVAYSFHLYSRSSHHFIQSYKCIHSAVNNARALAPSGVLGSNAAAYILHRRGFIHFIPAVSRERHISRFCKSPFSFL